MSNTFAAPLRARDRYAIDRVAAFENTAAITLRATTRAAARETQRRAALPAFAFDGDAATWAGVGIRAFLVTVLTLGVCYPWALVATAGWTAEHTKVDGHRLRFTGTARELFRRWLAWWALTVVTLGVYSFWVRPQLTRWVVEHQEPAVGS